MPRTLSSFLEEKFKERQRENYRLTLTAFAKSLGIKRENLNGYMNPNIQREPRIAHCVQMAKGLGLPLVDFLAATGIISETDASASENIQAVTDEHVPKVVRSAMATDDWFKLSPSPDEIEMVSRAELKDAESVLQAIRDLPWRMVKRLFQKHSVPREVQEQCYRFCRAVVFDWEGRFNTEEETGH